MRTRLVALREWLRRVHAPAYRSAKGTYLARSSVLATLITAVFVASTCLWDRAIDPDAGGLVTALRALQTLSVLALAPVIRYAPLGWATRIGLFAVPAFVQTTFLEILVQLDGGLSYGIGGFLYFFLFVPFMAQTQSLRFNAGLLAFIALFPNALVLMGASDAFNLAVYNAYVGMAFGPVVMMLALVEYLIHQVYSQHDELRQHADSDALTGLTNRRTFLERGRELMASAHALKRPVSVLFADLDHFKALNDRFGHAAGDDVLRLVAGRMNECVRGTDILARFGGEEFVLLLPDVGAGRAAIMAETIRHAISVIPVPLSDGSGRALSVTVSIGYAASDPAQPVALAELLRRADEAAYEAKAGGRNRAAGYGDAEPRAPTVEAPG